MTTITTFPNYGTPRITLSRGSGLNDDLITTPQRAFGTAGPVTSWESLNTMPKEISQYAIDPAVWEDTKEIQPHDIGTLDVFHRALINMRGGTIQKVHAAEELKGLMRIDADRTFNEIVPILDAELKKDNDLEFHGAAASSLVSVLRQMMKARNVQRILQVIEFVRKCVVSIAEDADLMAVWLEAMEGIIDNVSAKDATLHILPVVSEMSQEGKTPLSKKAAIIIARRLLQNPVDRKALETIWTIKTRDLADQDASVRAAAVGLNPDLTKNSEIPQVGTIVAELLGLAEDKEMSVLTAVVDATGKICMTGKVDRASCQTIAQLCKQILTRAFQRKPQNLQILVHFAKYLAIIAKSCETHEALSDEMRLWFIDTNIQLCRFDLPSMHESSLTKEMPPGFIRFRSKVDPRGKFHLLNSSTEEASPHSNAIRRSQRLSLNPTENNNSGVEPWIVRAHCAANFASFAEFAEPWIEFKGGVHNILRELFRDPEPNVRKNIAAHLLQVMELAGDYANLCKDEVVKALSDDNVDVIEALIPQLASILKIFVKTRVVSPEMNTAALAEVGAVLLFCEERLSQTRDWRVHSSLLLQLVVLPFCIPCDYIYQNFVPVLLHRLLHLNQLPSRLGAAEALISVMRHARRAVHRDDLRKKIRGFAHSPKAQDRLLYLYMSNMIMDRFSRKYYQEHFFETTLGLKDDSVPNVRLKTYRMIPKMRQKASDQLMASKLEEALEKISKSENDRDALEAITEAVEEIQKIGLGPSSTGTPVVIKADKDDEKKEIEERFVASLESKLPKHHHAKKSMGQKSGGGTKPSETIMFAPLTKTVALAADQPRRTIAERRTIVEPTPSPTAPTLTVPASTVRNSPSGGASGFYGGPEDSKNIVPLALGKSKALALNIEDSSSRTTPKPN